MTSTTYVLRIEDMEGRGPYAQAYARGAMYVHEHSGCPLQRSSHPDPYSDTDELADLWSNIVQCKHPTIGSLHSRFAFPTVEAYHRWFYTDDARALLHKLGYSLVLYSVPSTHVVASDRQAIYCKNSAHYFKRFACNLPFAELTKAVEEYIAYISAAQAFAQRAASHIERAAA